MTSSLPNAGVLRALSDETVMGALLDAGSATRAELAAATGLSKPTVTEAIRRLEAKGLARDTGRRTAGRGGVGTYYAPAGAAAGVALVVAVAPEGIVAEAIDAAGGCVRRAERPVERPITPAVLRRRLRAAARAALAGGQGTRAELAVVSAADPVDRSTGRLVHLPDAPFLVGDLDPVDTLSALVTGPVVVDNDVNWAARQELATRRQDDFVHLYLDEGLGCAVVSDGEVRRGHHGLAGEVAHLVTTGPNGRAMPFTAVFAELGLRRGRTDAIDVAALLAALENPRTLSSIAAAVADVVRAATALTDPSAVVLAGGWGLDPRLLAAVREIIDEDARPVAVDVAAEPTGASLAGARTAAVQNFRELIAARSRA